MKLETKKDITLMSLKDEKEKENEYENEDENKNILLEYMENVDDKLFKK